MGQQILAISDPVNESQMLSLKQKPSKVSLKRALNMRRYPEIELEFCADVAQVAKTIIDKAGGNSESCFALVVARLNLFPLALHGIWLYPL